MAPEISTNQVHLSELVHQLSQQFKNKKPAAELKRLTGTMETLPENTREKWIINIEQALNKILKITDQYRIFNQNRLPNYFAINCQENKLYIPVSSQSPSDILFEQKEFDKLVLILRNLVKHFREDTSPRVEDPLTEWVSDLDEVQFVEKPKVISWREKQELKNCRMLAEKFYYLSDDAQTPTDDSGVPVTMGYIRMQAQASLRYQLFRKEKFRPDLSHDEKQLLEGVKNIKDPTNEYVTAIAELHTNTLNRQKTVQEFVDECSHCNEVAKRYFYVSDETKLVADQSEVFITMGYIRLQAHSFINYQNKGNISPG